MPKYTVHKNPFKSDDFQTVEADRYLEEGSYTKFYRGDVEVLAVPTKMVTNITIE